MSSRSHHRVREDRRRAATGLVRLRQGRRLPAAVALGLLLAALSAVPVSAEPRRYKIDPNHLSIGFLVEHLGLAQVLGIFRQAEGSFLFDEESGVLSEVEISVVTDSVFTNQPDRDRHLRSPDFLNVRQFPQMRFSAKGATLDDERRARLEGELTLLGVSRPLQLEVTWMGSRVSPLPGSDGGRPYVLGASVRGSFKRSEFGMSYGVEPGIVGDEVELLIELEAQRD